MKYTFVNGSVTQKSRWEEAVGRLLNLLPEAVPLEVEVSFVAASELDNSHTTVADTTWAYDSVVSTTKVRNDAPGFVSLRESLEAEAAKLGIPFSPDRFYTETAIHELGHSLYAALPEENRIAIAQMFGAKGDSLAELAPSGTAWQDKIIEGIAETFKEAFLPRRFRVFPNRTNRKISYSKFPEFRKLWRDSVPNITGESRPAYDFDIFERGNTSLAGTWPDSRFGLYNGSGGGGFNFKSSCDFQSSVVEVSGGHLFLVEWLLTRNIFEAPTEGRAESATQLQILFEAFLGSEVFAAWKLTIIATWVPESAKASHEAFSGYQGTTASRDLGLGGEVEYLMWEASIKALETLPLTNPPSASGGSGKDGLIPPFTLSDSFTMPWPSKELKKPTIRAFLREAYLSSTHANEEAWINLLRATIPDFHFHQSATVGGEGEPIVVPAGSVLPAGAAGGAKPHIRPVTGGFL